MRILPYDFIILSFGSLEKKMFRERKEGKYTFCRGEKKKGKEKEENILRRKVCFLAKERRNDEGK